MVAICPIRFTHKFGGAIGIGGTKIYPPIPLCFDRPVDSYDYGNYSYLLGYGKTTMETYGRFYAYYNWTPHVLLLIQPYESISEKT